MKNFMIPTGTAFFPGTYMELLHKIAGMYGALDDENTFHCELGFPKWNREKAPFLIVKGRTHFLFRGRIERREDSCKITYTVHPTFTSALLLLIPVICLLYNLLNLGIQQILSSILASCFVSLITVGWFLLTRRSCMRQFVRKIEGEDESNFS